MATVTDVIHRIDGQLEALSGERLLSSLVDRASQSAFDDLRDRVTESYSSALKQLALGQAADAEGALKEIDDRLERSRLHLVQEAVSKSSSRLERIVTGPLWLGERGAYTQTLDRIQKETRSVSGEARRAQLGRLRRSLDELASVQKQVDADQRRIRVRLPIQVLLWGLPIVAGLWVSEKMSLRQNLLALGLLFFITAAVYLTLRFRVLSRFGPIRRLRTALQGSSRSTQFVVMFVMSMGTVLFAVAPILDDYFVSHRMDVEVGAFPKTFRKGTTVKIPYSLRYNSPGPATGVRIEFSIVGILSETTHEYPFVSNDQPRRGEFVFSVPTDLPPGEYGFEVLVRFTARRIVPLFAVPNYSSRRREKSGLIFVHD